MPTHRTVPSLKRCCFAIATILLIGFLGVTPSSAQSTNSPTNSPYAPSQPPPGVVDIAKWQAQQNQNPPSQYTQPTMQQTYNTLNSYDATRNLDHWTKNEIATNTPMGRSFLSGAYLNNGQANPFYSNGQLTPNWFVQATWTQPYMSWQGVQSNGFLPNASATTRSTSFATPVYNPTNYSPTNSAPRYQPPQPTIPTPNRDTTRSTNLSPVQPSLSVSPMRSGPLESAAIVAKTSSDRQRALAVSETAGDKVGQMVNHIGLAQAFLQQGDFTQAMLHVVAAEPMVKTAGDIKLRVDLLRAKSGAHMQAGEFESALADNREAIPILRSLNDAAGQAETFLSSAWAFQSMGDIQKAIGCYDAAFILFSNTGDKDGQVRSRIGIGSLYQSLGQYGKASAQYKAALPIASKSQQARIFASVAELLQGMGSPVDALAHFKKAQSLLTSGSDSSLEVSILTGMGRSLMATGEFKEAETIFGQARGIVEGTSNTAAKAGIIASMGELQYWIAINSPRADPYSHFKKALKDYDEALPLMRAIGDRAGEIGVLTNSGLVYDAQGKSKVALSYYLQALDKMENLQTQARLEEFRSNIAGQSAGLYQRAIYLEFETHQASAAFVLSERARARMLLDQLGNPRIDDYKQAPPEFLSREEQFRREYITLERQLGQEISRPGPDLNSERISKLQSRLVAIRGSYESLLNQLSLSNPRYAAFLSVMPITVEMAQERLDPATTIISYVTTPDRTFAFILTKAGLRLKSLSIGEAGLIHEIGAFRDFASNTEVSPALRILYKALIEPLRSEIKTTKLVIVPHGVLHELPFAALTSNGRHFLADDYSISYLPSVSALSYLHSKKGSPSERALVLANDQEDGLPFLGSAGDEAQAVAAFFNAKPFLGKDATPAVLRKEATDYDILHLVAHFEINRKNPMASRILLGHGENDGDGPLDLAGVYGLSLRKTDLVVLSGCQSQSGKRTRADDIIGLSRAFLYAGSSSVIASLWSVDDDATKLLMVAFYSHLRQGLSKADALRAAQADVRRQYQSPFYWAGFVLTGDPGQTGTSNLLASSAN
jgi:CHAT domain-containing protein/tetratricopeptide (TPR) repeat protein